MKKPIFGCFLIIFFYDCENTLVLISNEAHNTHTHLQQCACAQAVLTDMHKSNVTSIPAACLFPEGIFRALEGWLEETAVMTAGQEVTALLW